MGTPGQRFFLAPGHGVEQLPDELLGPFVVDFLEQVVLFMRFFWSGVTALFRKLTMFSVIADSLWSLSGSGCINFPCKTPRMA